MFADTDSRRATAARIVLVLIAAAALVLLGRLTAPTHQPMRTEAGVPVGFDRNQDGARAAAATYAAARARATLLAPQRRRALLDAIGTERFAAAADREDEQRDLAPLSGQEEGRYLVAPLGSSVDVYAEDRVRLTAWLFQVWAADAAVGSFSTQTVTLVWQDKGWRLDEQIDSDTQAVPQLTQEPRHEDTRRLVDELPPFF